ncbi:MAG: hypothetical protein BHV99_04075 [Clostridium sp. 26_21]|nr:MAG: hypothetical protein BHV99_04075 [Clostridium sp. 26_21]
MSLKRQNNKKQHNLKFIISGIIILICIVLVLIVKINKKKDELNDNSKENDEGISLYDTSISEYVKETEDGIKINTSALINSDKMLDNLTITNIQLIYNSGITSLTANVTNNSNVETPITTITAILKDEKEQEICNVKGVIRALKIGETGRLNISMSGNFITAYNIEFSK